MGASAAALQAGTASAAPLSRRRTRTPGPVGQRASER